MGFNSGFIGLIAVCTVKNKRRNSSVIGGTEHVTQYPSGFGGLEVAYLAFGTQVRWFAPGRSRRIFRAKNSSACLPSEA